MNRDILVVDSQWHWLDGSIVKDSVITWCPNSTYETAIGTYCAAYDSDLNCVTNYLCSTLLPAPCVASSLDLICLIRFLFFFYKI